MGLPNNDQYIRGMALESAVKLASSPDFGKSVGGFRVRPDENDILDLADKFADYIRLGRE